MKYIECNWTTSRFNNRCIYKFLNSLLFLICKDLIKENDDIIFNDVCEAKIFVENITKRALKLVIYL